MYSLKDSIIIAVLIGLWVLHNFATIRVARRLKFETVWPVWIPFAGKFYVYAKMAEMSGWSTLWCFIPIVNYIGTPIMILIWFFRIGDRIKRAGWPSILIGPGLMFFWAWESDKDFKKRMAKKH